MTIPFALKPSRATLVLLHDIVAAVLAFLLALFFRVGSELWDSAPWVMVGTAVLCALVSGAVFKLTGLYRGIWRYASLDDFVAILRASALSSLITLAILFLATRVDSLPRSTPVVAWLLLVPFLTLPRFAYRVFKDGHFSNLLTRDQHRNRVPVLLIGAGDEAELFIREMMRNPTGAYRAVGIVNETEGQVGRAIHSVPILGKLDELQKIVEGLAGGEKAPQRLILTRERLDPEQFSRLLEAAETLALPLRRLPKITEFKLGGGSASFEPRPIALEDLLGRPQTPLDRSALSALVAGRRVLVTGAGGSIGGELVRQLAGLGPVAITLVDSSEFALYSIDMELAEAAPELPRRPILADVRDRDQMAGIFAEFQPALVFHAAALKHVPLVEENPIEGVLTNVVGTRNIAELCTRFDVEAMVMISTDKAVNPSNVMGATKRMAEAVCQNLDMAARRAGRRTRYVTVRFGNVLGSTGSVVPLFQRQLARGGPLTVTHPDITRYFMTIREAVELVLTAATLGLESDGQDEGGRIFVLDMGAPVRIVDLARQMIRLAGLRPDRDIAIEITGLRAGEKLHEELFHDGEALVETRQSGIRLAMPRLSDAALLERGLDRLAAAARGRDLPETLAALAALVPEFSSVSAASATVRPNPVALQQTGS